jgi:hypothetical protein
MKKYQVWVTLEEWDGENKICDTESSCIGELGNEDEGRQAFQATEALGLAVKDFIPVKWID